MPIYNWFKLHETGETKYLHKQLKEHNRAYLWQQLSSEMIDVFGFSDEYADEINLRRKIALLEIKAAMSENKMLINVVNIHKAELKEMTSNTVKENIDYFQQIAQMEDIKGRNIDEHKLSVRKYYTYLKDYGRANNKKG